MFQAENAEHFQTLVHDALQGRIDTNHWREQGYRAGAAAAIALGALAAGLAGCSEGPALPKLADMNPFLKKDPPLPGKRVAIMEATGSLANNLAPAERPITLPPPQANDEWAQPGGMASNAPVHLALNSTVKQAWSADAGAGSSASAKVTASPIVYDGRVYTLDAAARVSAFAVAGGSSIWRVSLVPESEQKSASFFSLGGSNFGGYGGGMAADGGRLYVATGFGNLSALEPKTGKVLWTKTLGAPIRSSPTAASDRVYVNTTEGRIFALAGSDGNELWSTRGLPEAASLIASPSPAIEGDIIVAPFSTGEVMGLRVASGETAWTESLTRMRGSSAMAAMSDAARPVIDNGTVFAVGHGGRMIASQVRTGERIWSINMASTQPPWPAGDNVFVVDTVGQLLALNRRDGQILWTIKLPDSNVWSGPTLAGGTLWLVSNKGTLVGVEATTGRITGQHSLGNPAYIAPVVAGGRLYVLTHNARLIAYN